MDSSFQQNETRQVVNHKRSYYSWSPDSLYQHHDEKDEQRVSITNFNLFLSRWSEKRNKSVVPPNQAILLITIHDEVISMPLSSNANGYKRRSVNCEEFRPREAVITFDYKLLSNPENTWFVNDLTTKLVSEKHLLLGQESVAAAKKIAQDFGFYIDKYYGKFKKADYDLSLPKGVRYVLVVEVTRSTNVLDADQLSGCCFTDSLRFVYPDCDERQKQLFRAVYEYNGDDEDYESDEERYAATFWRDIGLPVIPVEKTANFV